jgi:FMN reductase
MSAATLPAPLVVGVGGSTRAGSSSELVLRAVLDAAERRGARTRLFAAAELPTRPYDPAGIDDPAAGPFLDALRRADAFVLASPGYHGQLSGLVKNALDYTEELRDDERPYFDGCVIGTIAVAFGWQAAVNTLTALRQVAHALRGWPTPLGIAINAAEPDVVRDSRLVGEHALANVELLADQLLDGPRPTAINHDPFTRSTT